MRIAIGCQELLQLGDVMVPDTLVSTQKSVTFSYRSRLQWHSVHGTSLIGFADVGILL